MKNLYFALSYGEDILGSFYGTREKADSHFSTTFNNEYMGLSGDCDIIQTREDARKVIMDQTDAARESYNAISDVEKGFYDGRISYYNSYLKKVVPEHIRKLAV